MPRPRTSFFVAVLLAAAALLGWTVLSRPAEPQRPIGLFTSLPIVWGETDQLGELLKQDRTLHRVKGALAAFGPVRPLDTLQDLGPDLKQLLIAQPRPLSPAENVALDTWVRGGGQLLLVADPMLTEHSAYALGDPRRPQDVVLLSPILSRWGLELTFDDRQPAGLRTVAELPVDLPGRWRTTSPDCQLAAEALLAECRVGQGRVLALADAEVLATNDADGLRDPALTRLLQRAFSKP